MKQLAITIICACMALAAMAQVPMSDVAQLRQAFKNRPVAAATSVTQGKTGQVSFHQLMREHNLTPNDNRLMENSPYRHSSPADIIGDRIMTLEAQAIDYDSVGIAGISDTVFTMGWNTVISENYYIENFFGEYVLPIYFLGDDTPFLCSCYLRNDSIQGRQYDGHRTDTVRSVIFFTLDGFFNGNYGYQPGTLYDDGSILFDGSFIIYYEEIFYKYVIASSSENLISTDTTASISPVLSDIYLLKPNGVHEYNMSFHDEMEDLSNFDLTRVDWSTHLGFEESGSGDSGSGGQVVVIGGGGASTLGLHPHPIDLRMLSRGSMTSFIPNLTVSEDQNGDISKLNRVILDSVFWQKNSLIYTLFGDEGLGFHPRPPYGPGNGKKYPVSGNSELVITPGTEPSGLHPRPPGRPMKDDPSGDGLVRNSNPYRTTAVGDENQDEDIVKLGLETDFSSLDRITLDSLRVIHLVLDSFGYLFGSVIGPLGIHPRPPKGGGPGNVRRNPAPGDGGLLYNPSGTSFGAPVQSPVYMFQLDDSTICVFNLFDVGFTANFMTLDPYGNMSFPPQMLFYDESKNEDFYNGTLDGDTLIMGIKGTATSDTITWNNTWPIGYNSKYVKSYDNNKLYFNDGTKLELPDLLGDVNRDKNLSITDVTVLINHLLNQDFEKTDSFSPEAADINKDDAVTIRDITMLINNLLSSGHQ